MVRLTGWRPAGRRGNDGGAVDGGPAPRPPMSCVQKKLLKAKQLPLLPLLLAAPGSKLWRRSAEPQPAGAAPPAAPPVAPAAAGCLRVPNPPPEGLHPTADRTDREFLGLKPAAAAVPRLSCGPPEHRPWGRSVAARWPPGDTAGAVAGAAAAAHIAAGGPVAAGAVPQRSCVRNSREEGSPPCHPCVPCALHTHTHTHVRTPGTF